MDCTVIGCHQRGARITGNRLVAVLSEEEWNEVMDVNVGGMFRLARAVCRP